MKIDQHLLHTFRLAGGGLGSGEEFRDETGRIPSSIRLPMLLHVDPSWRSENVPEFEQSSRLGNIVAGTGTLDSLSALDNDPLVIRIEASRSTSGSDLSNSLKFVKGDVVHRPPLAESGDRALVAIIDNEVDVLHEAFRDGHGNTRILEIWDQRDSTGPRPNIVGLMGYGTIHHKAQINEYIASGSVPQSLGRDSNGHGTHVASIAAGRAAGSFAGGMAPDAKIIIVKPKLQTSPNDRLSLGYSTSHQDALAYIKGSAIKWQLPVVVNVSLGMNAGAHDGTSLLEAAFNEFSGGGRTPGFVIVKSAGNEHATRGHARLKMPSNARDFIKWHCRMPHFGPDFIELWWTASDEVQFTLIDPRNVPIATVDAVNNSAVGTCPQGNSYQLSYTRYHHDNGDSRLLVTIASGSATSIDTGDWTLQIDSQTIRSGGEIHAWIERNATRPIEFITHINDETTLSIPATAETVIAVASVGITGASTYVSSYSSYGLTRDGRLKPDLAAPGEQIQAAQAMTANQTAAMSGTSIAAPHVTGAIALLLSHCEKARGHKNNVNAAQIRAAITQMTQNYSGYHNPGMGYGVLDVEALLNAFK